MPPRLKNRNISTHEVLILEMEAQIAGDLRRAILSEARGVMATRPLGMNGTYKYYWIRFSKLLLRRHYQRIRDTFFGQERNWENIARSWIRRTIEMRNNNQLLELIASKMEDIPCGKRPDNWSQRPSIRCAVCVVEAIQSGRDSEWCTQNHAGGKLRIFPRTLSQLAGIRDHVERYHTDLGSKRVCIACSRVCANARGCYVHQLAKHYDYEQKQAHTIASLMHNLEVRLAEALAVVGLPEKPKD